MRIINRIFRRDFESIDTYEAGVMLLGAEVKSIRAGNLKLENSFVKITDGEAYLTNAEVPIYRFARPADYDPVRRRKLLLHQKELIKMQTKIASGGRLTIVPEACYTKGRHIKLSIALVRPRGEIAKKKLERAEDIKTKQKQEMKEYMKR